MIYKIKYSYSNPRQLTAYHDNVLIGVVSYANGSDIFSFLRFNNIVLHRVVILVVNNLKNHRM